MTRIGILLAIGASTAFGQSAIAAKVIKPPQIVNGANDPSTTGTTAAQPSTVGRAETASERRERRRMEHDMVICKGC